ncbi:MAG: hypothetical protein ACR2MN_12565 [Acidimicrobiales bacterium]
MDDLGAGHSPVREAGYAVFVSVFDPDGTPWELWAAGSQEVAGGSLAAKESSATSSSSSPVATDSLSFSCLSPSSSPS